MTTIDHAAEARKHLADAVTDPQATPWDLTDEHEQWHIDATLSVAQVHATLALVEQQRIANIIALNVPQQVLGEPKGTRGSIPSFVKGMELRDDIKKGLGI